VSRVLHLTRHREIGHFGDEDNVAVVDELNWQELSHEDQQHIYHSTHQTA